MIGTLLLVLLVVWLVSAVLPLNGGSPYVAVGGAPSLGYIVAVILVIFIVLHYLVPALRSF